LSHGMGLFPDPSLELLPALASNVTAGWRGLDRGHHMAEWLVSLDGQKFDLQDLATQLQSPDWSVEEDRGGYVLRSSAFGLLTTDGQVFERANQLVQTINGLAAVVIPGFQPVQVGHVVRVHDDGRRLAHAYLSGTMTARGRLTATPVVAGRSRPQPRQVSPLESLLRVASGDSKVVEAMRYFQARGRRWLNLYKVLEVIEQDVGGDRALRAKGWVSGRSLRRFTNTADNAGAIGDEARHAERGWKPPARAMPLQEAEDLIRSLIEAWLRSKAPRA
jgi:hypothetical protein